MMEANPRWDPYEGEVLAFLKTKLSLLDDISQVGLHWADQARPSLLRQVQESYVGLRHNEALLLVYDDTLFGSGKDGFVLTTRRIQWKNAFLDPKWLEYKDTAGVFFASGLTRNLKFKDGSEVAVSKLQREAEAVVAFLDGVHAHATKQAKKAAAAAPLAPQGEAPSPEAEAPPDAWHYALGQVKHGPFPAATIRARIEAGEFRPSEALVWRRGMADWEAMSQHPNTFPAPPAPAAPERDPDEPPPLPPSR